MIFITRKHEFCASHRLYNPNFSDEKNEATFGLCNNKNGHGHNYVLEVTLSGEVCEDTGMVFDLKELKKLTTQEVLNKVDHKNLNVDVDFLKDIKAILRNDMTLHVGSLNDIDVNVANKSLSNSSPIGLFTSLISEHTL
jgi:6-pyruvoyltetrahydropterin/6-carboxytetrahydropterin synthase